jgi:YVTN family beta-propeller protein
MKSGFVFLIASILSAMAAVAELSLVKVVDIPLPGKASRFDYQSFDSVTKTLYFTHMGGGELVVFDTKARKVVQSIPGLPTCTGVLVVPELNRAYVSVADNHEVAVIDTQTLKVIARVPSGDFPDGIAYAPESKKIYVSDESKGKETVIDVKTNQRVATIDMGGEVGNTQYDPVSKHILANVQTSNELVVIDPKTDKIIGRHTLPDAEGAHGLLIHADKRLAFVACEGNSKLLVVDLEKFEVKQSFSTGRGPDVLTFDSRLGRLYVAAESGIVSIFQLKERTLEKLEDLNIAPHAHTVCVNPENHEVYLPLKNIEGHPVLRVMKPSSF